MGTEQQQQTEEFMRELAEIDAIIDEWFAEDNGITVEEIPAFIAKQKEQDGTENDN